MNEKQRKQIEFIDELYNKVVLKQESAIPKYPIDRHSQPYELHNKENS